MTKRTIEKILSEKFHEWVKSIKDGDVRDQVEKNSIITGGAIVSFLLNEEPNDFDIYFTDQETTLAIAKYYVDRFNTLNDTSYEVREHDGRIEPYLPEDGIVKGEYKKNKGSYQALVLSSNAISLSDQVQLIIRFYGSPEEIHKNFDFAHTTNYWESSTGKLTLVPEAIESILTKRLFYRGSLYPIASMIRIRKFLERGWHISAGQILKMAYQVSKLNLDDVDVLKEQLVSVDAMYFFSLLDKLKNSDRAIDSKWLSELIDEVFE